jgi:hypothetical protein
MKNPIKQFKLKNEYFCSVQDIKYAILHDLSGKIVLQGNSVGVKDHPEFTKLRNRLSKMGYILMETSYWNGDIVLKPFKLNKVNFKKGEQFACADAINIKMNSLK